jgi:hypothetical protein
MHQPWQSTCPIDEHVIDAFKQYFIHPNTNHGTCLSIIMHYKDTYFLSHSHDDTAHCKQRKYEAEIAVPVFPFQVLVPVMYPAGEDVRRQ